MRLASTSVYILVSTIFSVLSSFIIAKFIASFCGVVTYGLYGQFLSFVALVQVFSGGIFRNGVVKYTSQFREKKETLDLIISSASSVSFLMSILTGVVVIIFAKYLAVLTFNSIDYIWVFYLFGVTLWGYVINNFVLAVLNGLNKMFDYMILSIISSVMSIIAIPFMVYKYSTNGVISGFILGQVLMFVATLIYSYRLNVKMSLFSIRMKVSIIKRLVKFSVMSVFAAICLPLSLIIVRLYVASNSSWSEVGYWDAMNKVSNAYLIIFTTIIAAYTIPKYSAIKKSDLLKEEVLKLLMIFVPFVAFSALIIFFLKKVVIVVLFSREFMPMSILFHFQLIGDIFMIASWIVINAFMAKGKILIYIILQITSSVILMILSLVFFKIFGLEGLSFGFMVTYIICFIIYILLFFYIFKKV
ncbi:O-antigen translocase [Francisella tularensis subsp. novicida]|uniref:O-antigen translocase n=3 Tax=Francisella tularensis TaxID=263 RepID=A0A6I4RRD2_FRATU|nr:O-antigen translocase [Francisella tularensis]ABK81668.1 Wzx [Francisella tularensis subsp. novicida U112]ABK90288.1 O antigen flippase [Francisella tularensis subsp. novicida U112]AJI61162.1 polysaccharide biosynthesis family protein [Francisella tularensis subsp. novicida U112]EDX20060.1 polysaccharide biosynthesis protein [Francisella tularensis subsp. novicida FTE]MBK2035886.1 O-antigen translocase [Francisella tularensis subsp. novicida]